ncbi:hypothetical protein HDC32_000611 [Pseudomonas sp. JAI120]|nr:hypothetical protein [Pseudomonas sp. SJZ073]MBB6310942.1 hypothetical protein [Pseudomonas sp. JAI120]
MLPIAECQSTDLLADPPSSGASPLPHSDRGVSAHAYFNHATFGSRPCDRNLPDVNSSTVEGGLLPIAECQSTDLLADPPSSGASPLPHSDRGVSAHAYFNRATFGSRPCDRNLPDVNSSTVGGGLLPIAEFQSTDSLADPPSSGASPLPHSDRGVSAHAYFNHATFGSRPCDRNLPDVNNSTVGGGLLPIAECQSTDLLADPPSSGQAPSHVQTEACQPRPISTTPAFNRTGHTRKR